MAKKRTSKKVVKKAAKKAGKRVAARPKATAKKKVAPIPAGYYSVTPYLVCRGALEAMAFYGKAFGAKKKLLMLGPDGKVGHAELRIGDSIVMLGEEMPKMGATAPPTLGGTATGLFLYLKNVDQAFAKAIAAGATSEMPPTDMFWGDRYAKLVDPFGHKWSMATRTEDLSPKEMARRGQAFMAQQADGQQS
jgi:PhnB protein